MSTVTVFKLRCMNCRNLTGAVNLRVLPDGRVLCARCAQHHQVVTGPGGTVEFVGA